MTKPTIQETIEAFKTELAKIGDSFHTLSEYANVLAQADQGAEVVAPAKKDSKKSKKEVVGDSFEDEAEEIIEEEEGIDLQELSIKELKSFAKENEIELPAGKLTKAQIIKAIEEELLGEEEIEADEEDSDEEEDGVASTVVTVLNEDEEEEDVDLAEMNVKQLKAFAEDYGIELTAKKKDDIIEEILTAFTEEEGEEEDDADDESDGADDVDDSDDDEAEESDEDEEEEVDYAEELGLNDMDVKELADLCEEHGLSTKGKKQALISRIVSAIEDGTIELDEEEGE